MGHLRVPFFIPGENMADAQNTPVRRAKPEFNTADLEVGQRSSVILPNEGDVRAEDIILPVDINALNKVYMDAIAFNEQAIKIVIHPSRERNAPNVFDCWVNGRGAEVFMNGKWQTLGYLPVGIPVITKRKYVEVLASSKIENINTEVIDTTTDKLPINKVHRNNSATCTFQVIEDKDPRGVEWLTRLYATAN